VTDLDFVFPVGVGVIKGGGDLAFHHGGVSLEEMVIPVVTVRLKVRPSNRPMGQVTVSEVPDAITNRIFKVHIHPGLFGTTVRPFLVYAGRQVGAVGLTIDAELDRATGCVKLTPGKLATVAFLLRDDQVPTLRLL
jgi:hypothetical protein